MNLSFSSIVRTIKYKNGSNEAVSTENVSKIPKLSPGTALSEIKYKEDKLQYDNIRVNRVCTIHYNILTFSIF